MSELSSNSPSYESYVPPAPKVPTLWERALDQARAEIAAAGGLAARSDFLESHGNISWMATADREEALRKSMLSALETNAARDHSLLEFAGGEALLRLNSMLEAMAGVPQLAVMAGLESGFSRLESQTSELLRLARTGSAENILERSALLESELREITGRAHQRLALAEGDLLRETMGDALQELGYMVSSKGNALRATRGTTCIWAEMTDRGGLNLDVSGFSGRSCQTEIKALENMLARRGLILKRTATNGHQNILGGDLAQRLSRVFNQKPLPATGAEKLWGAPKPASSTVQHCVRQEMKRTFSAPGVL